MKCITLVTELNYTPSSYGKLPEFGGVSSLFIDVIDQS